MWRTRKPNGSVQKRLDDVPSLPKQLQISDHVDLVLSRELHRKIRVVREQVRVVWSAETFVDFEHGLNAAVRRLRATR